MVIRIISIILIASLLMACSDKGVDPEASQDLEENETKWQSQGLTNYQINTQRLCFCDADSVREITIIVRDNEVSEAFYTDSGDYLPADRLEHLRTIDEHFEVIHDAINRDAFSLVIEYNATFGYPSLIDIDYSEGMADDEVTYRLSNLQ